MAWCELELYFVGGYHGLCQIVSELSMPIRDVLIRKLKVNTRCISYSLGKTVITFLVVCFGWIFFRMDSVLNSMRFIKRMFTRPNLWVLHDQSLYTIGLDRGEMNILIMSLSVLLLVDVIRYKKKVTIEKYLEEQNLWFRWSVVIILFMATIIYGIYGPAYDPVQFIYFQF